MRKHAITFILILVTTFIFINHLGTAIPFPVVEDTQSPKAVFIERSLNSHRHVILQGSDYKRGFEYGELVRSSLLRQEKHMISKLDYFIGNHFVQKVFFTSLMVWFFDADKYIDQASKEEMNGVAQSAPREFDRLASGYTRQIAYHGLHEVGQMFVDEDRVDMGCFVSIVRSKENDFVIGRNFDFDVDGVFDQEKLLKWVYPLKGNAFLSVTWPGMVGVVSGVNEKGIYVSINSAGTDDFVRMGTPTTIVLKNILLEANTIDAAIKQIEMAQTFISEIFVVADKKYNRVAVIEKSPRRVYVRYIYQSEVVANHFEADMWKGDKTNEKRKVELTSELRKRRGQELIKDDTYLNPVEKTAEILRDKTLADGRLTHIGNRGAIDSLIASQSLIFDLKNGIFYANLGPGTSGKYLGYDLDKSFQMKSPVVVKEISAVGLSVSDYYQWQDSIQKVVEAKKNLEKNDCKKVETTLELLASRKFVHHDHRRLAGDYFFKCLKDEVSAKKWWREALAFYPPYEKQRKYLEERIK